jgi:uncharacterized membrane protein YidH (DUF202 family)
MKPLKLVAIVLIVVGIVALAYGTITYSQETHNTKIGRLEMSVTDKKTVDIPMWAGIAAIVGGAALLLVPKKT